MQEKKRIITIDGPAGSGKSTVAKLLAQELGLLYLDTGALYRAVAYKMMVSGLDGSSESALGTLLAKTSIILKKNHAGLAVWVDREDVSQKIRTEEIAVLASTASAISLVRKALLPIQRACGEEAGLVAEGRDMGTVVFPDAYSKFYLHASPEVRSRRRYLELIAKGLRPEAEEIKASIVLRDRQDRERSVSPLRIPDQATVIDSTELSIPEVMAVIRSTLGK